jgi:hypothetical protein
MFFTKKRDIFVLKKNLKNIINDKTSDNFRKSYVICGWVYRIIISNIQTKRWRRTCLWVWLEIKDCRLARKIFLSFTVSSQQASIRVILCVVVAGRCYFGSMSSDTLTLVSKSLQSILQPSQSSPDAERQDPQPLQGRLAFEF